MKYETMLDAARGWVNEFNAFPLGMIEKIYTIDYDFIDITLVTECSRVWSNAYQACGEVTDITEDEDGNEIIKVELDSGEEIETERDDLSREDDDYFPMWGTLWQFNDSSDEWWLENHLEEMAACGFRIYESGEFGYFFGIDGAGYDFYEAHWIPLYKARGLQWHEAA